MEWTRANLRVDRTCLGVELPDALSRHHSAIVEAAYLQGLSFQERSLGEPQSEVQPGDEEQAAHGLQSLDEERSRGEIEGEVQTVDELQAAHDSHSSG